MASLQGKVAIVTGGGQGLGEAVALALAEAGADVAVAGRTPSTLERVAAKIEKLGRRAHVARTDITDAAEADRMVASVVEAFGKLDVLVNNAGILHNATVLDTTDEQWDAVVATNLRGTFLATRAAGRTMVAQGSGRVINIASNFAYKGVPGFASYSASKAAIIAFTRTVAVEWARHGVQVNALAPGYFATAINADVRAEARTAERIRRQIPAGRMGDPDELGRWAVLLADPTTRFITGETIVIDGGQLAK
jgi:2-deoxy-D-gluconate 3-dehydrogenase